MPSPVSARQSQEELYDAQARSRSGYSRSHRYRHRHRSYVRVPHNPVVSSTPALVATLVQQKEIPWTGVDVSSQLRPTQVWVDFTKAPDNRVTDIGVTDPALIVLRNLDARIAYLKDNPVDTREPLAYFIILMGFIVLGWGVEEELERLKTCHKRLGYTLFNRRNAPRWVRLAVRRRLKGLLNLT